VEPYLGDAGVLLVEGAETQRYREFHRDLIRRNKKERLFTTLSNRQLSVSKIVACALEVFRYRGNYPMWKHRL
ncbi:MAG: hypothetical protein K2N16_01170, partial [Muribaculaceae bacterium]|nr:hypothetical protein [Muribaculaceae bacterium]